MSTAIDFRKFALPPLPEDAIALNGRAYGYAITSSGIVLGCKKRRGISSCWLPIKLHINKSGYLCVNIKANGKGKWHFVHRLVLEAFGPKRCDGQQTLHIDGNKLNNHISNLRWGTAKENAADRVSHGKQARLFGETNPQSVLTAVKVVEIRRCKSKGESSASLSNRFGVTCHHINQIVARRRWKHIS